MSDTKWIHFEIEGKFIRETLAKAKLSDTPANRKLVVKAMFVQANISMYTLDLPEIVKDFWLSDHPEEQ